MNSKIERLLLADHSTNGLIIQATGLNPLCPVDPSTIKPRWLKAKEEQKSRTKHNGEVFTPLWLVNKMIDNLEDEDPIRLLRYVEKTFLEICCGEAPFIAQLYDPVSGESIPLSERKGILDRKLQLIPKDKLKEDWLYLGFLALKSVYGYEYQGDSLYLARLNVLKDFIEHYEEAIGEIASEEIQEEAARIISWNFLQMDGLTYQVPLKKAPVYLMDWESRKMVRFKIA